MIEFIISLIVIVICYLLFGKADTKREILNQVGLDLSEDCYNSKKESEFEKYCKKSIKIAAKGFEGETEDDFLSFTGNFLSNVYWNDSYIGIKKHYVSFARIVIDRRKRDIFAGNEDKISRRFNFSDSVSRNNYIRILWEKYQYPWPQDWLKSDRS